MHREQEKSWFQKNWWWAVPGCGCLGIVLLAAVTCGGLGLFVSQKIGEVNEQVFGEAMERAKNHPAVVAVTGEPVEVGFGNKFNIHFENGTGIAEREADLSGPDGAGIVYIDMIQSGDSWEIESLWFQPDGDDRKIDLMAEEP